jgi:hypothetical protein
MFLMIFRLRRSRMRLRFRCFKSQIYTHLSRAEERKDSSWWTYAISYSEALLLPFSYQLRISPIFWCKFIPCLVLTVLSFLDSRSQRRLLCCNLFFHLPQKFNAMRKIRFSNIWFACLVYHRVRNDSLRRIPASAYFSSQLSTSIEVLVRFVRLYFRVLRSWWAIFPSPIFFFSLTFCAAISICCPRSREMYAAPKKEIRESVTPSA